MDDIVLGLISPGIRGVSVWMWLPWLYELVCLLAGACIGLLAMACLSRTGRRHAERLLELSVPPRALRRTMRTALAAFLVFFFLLKTAQYVTFQGRNHVAMYLSMIWNTGSGAFLPNFLFGLKTHLGDHFEPIVALYWPLARLGSPWLTLMFHNLIVLSSLWVVWRLTRAWGLSWPLRYLVMALYLTNGFLQSDLSALLVPPPLALPILLLVLLAWEEDRPAAYAASCALLLCVREEAPVALIALGAASLCVPGRRRLGIWTLAAGALAFGAENRVMRHFSEHMESKWTRFFGKSEGLGGLLASWAWPPAKFAPFLSLFFSSGALAALYPPACLALLVLGAPHQASSGGNAHFHLLELYYTSFLIPFLIWGSGRGLGELWRRAGRYRHFALSGVLALIAKGAMGMHPHALFQRLSPERLRAGWSAVLRVRPEESVECSDAFSPSLALRSKLKIRGLGDPRQPAFEPDVLLVDLQEEARLGTEARSELLEKLRRGRFALESSEQGVLLFRRIRP